QEVVSSILPPDRLMASRPDILDLNGEVLATDIRTVSLFAEPNKISRPTRLFACPDFFLRDPSIARQAGEGPPNRL
ncbi:hypothetical protein AB9F39_36405, partial [Rhizobium leguminosarum]